MEDRGAVLHCWSWAEQSLQIQLGLEGLSELHFCELIPQRPPSLGEQTWARKQDSSSGRGLDGYGVESDWVSLEPKKGTWALLHGRGHSWPPGPTH